MSVVLEGTAPIKCSSIILSIGNATLAELISDKDYKGILQLFEGVNEDTFLEVEKYYGGGCMNVDVDNVCEILKFSLYYNDKKILNICYKFIRSHFDGKVLVNIFNSPELIHLQKSNLYELSKNALISDVYKYIKDDDSLLALTFNSLYILLNTPDLIIKNETWLLERLLKWFTNYKQKQETEIQKGKIREREEQNGKAREENDDEEVEYVFSIPNFVNLIFNRVNLDAVKWEEIKDKYNNILKELMINDYSGSRNHLCICNDDIDEKLSLIIQKYYDDNIYSINEEDLNELYAIDINEVKKLFTEKEIRIIKTAIIIIIDTKSVVDIDKTIKFQLTSKLCLDYTDNQSVKTVKCLTYFTDAKELIQNIYNLCEDKDIIYKLLNFHTVLLKESKEQLIIFLREKFKLNNEIIHKYIVNDELIDELQNKITVLSYPSSSYSFILNENVSIRPECDSSKCEFTVTPNLPEGVNIDKETGEISGKIVKVMDKTEFTVICSNIWSKLNFRLSLQFKDVVFMESIYDDPDLQKIRYAEITKDGKIMIQMSDEIYSRRWLDLEMKDGIYHIFFQYNCRGNKNKLTFGISNTGVCYGDAISKSSNKCLYCNVECEGKNVEGSLCRIVEKKPAFINHGNGSIYEIIVDINNKQFWIKHNNSKAILVAEDFSPPVYALVSLYYVNTSVTLKSVIHKRD